MERLGTPYNRGQPCSDCRGHCTTDTSSSASVLASKRGHRHGNRTHKQGVKRHSYRGGRKQAKKKMKMRLGLMKKKAAYKNRISKHPLATNEIPSSKLNQEYELRKEKKEQRWNKKRPIRKHQLCTNSCHVADRYTNCDDMVAQWPNWICNSRNTTEGLDRFKHCLATCLCRGKIYN